MKVPISATQCRAARRLLGWSQEDLAGEIGMSTSTIATFERGSRNPYAGTLMSIRNTLEVAGIDFSEPGVKLKAKGKKGKR
jgi:transcriptional regulator with XRE-family HTH domain